MAECASPRRRNQGTVLCRYFLHGSCRRGQECTFSHNLESSTPSNVCRYYLKGYCSYGDSCRYDHVRDEQKRQTSSSETNRVDTPKKKMTPIVSDKSSVNSKMTPLRKKGSKQVPKTSHSREPKEWVKAKVFVPGRRYNDPLKYSEAVGGIAEPEIRDTSKDKDLLCPYIVHGDCQFGDNCSFTHGDICDLCGLARLFPGNKEQNKAHRKECVEDHQKAMEESFAHQRSKDKACGICMEVVMEKMPPSERRFGILSNCKHVFCLSCIRTWRGAKQFEKKNVRSCPECRVQSDFVTPSKYWADTDEDKQQLMGDYKTVLSTKHCKYFKHGKGECPFYDKCFYLHAFPDGTKAPPKPRPPRRRYVNSDNQIDLIEHILLLDFLEHRENQRLYGMFEDDDDEDDIYDMLFGYDSFDDSDYEESDLLF